MFSRSIQYAVFERSVGNSTWSICPGALARLPATSINPTAAPRPLSGPLRLGLVPGGTDPEPFLGNCQVFLQTLQSTKLLYINALGGSCPQQCTALPSPRCSGVTQAKDHSSCAVGKVSLLALMEAAGPALCIHGRGCITLLFMRSSFRIPTVPARPTCYSLIAAVPLSAVLVSSQSHNTKFQHVEFRYN